MSAYRLQFAAGYSSVKDEQDEDDVTQCNLLFSNMVATISRARTN